LDSRRWNNFHYSQKLYPESEKTGRKTKDKQMNIIDFKQKAVSTALAQTYTLPAAGRACAILIY